MIYWIVTPRQDGTAQSHYFRDVQTVFHNTAAPHKYHDSYLHICPNKIAEYHDVVTVPEDLVPEFEEFLAHVTASGVEMIVLGRSE